MTRYLLADIGGTHTRVAEAVPGEPPGPVTQYRNRDLAGPSEALQRHRTGHADEDWWVAAAVAGPVAQGEVRLTNLGWQLEVGELACRTGAARAELVNDYQALARALPELDPAAHCTVLRSGTPASGGAMAVLGPGTGLGVSGLVPAVRGWGVIAGEGGHVTLAAADETEATLLGALRGELGHVSAEAVLSGPGLSRLHRVLHGVEAAPEAITAADGEADPAARETIDRFLALLGGTAGNLALTLGARAGVFLAGGILPRLSASRLADSPLLERFLAKGRFRSYLEPVPVWRIDDPAAAALLGLRAWLDDLRYP
ncbi:MAG: glucokinase [Halorhodospira halophila]|uniref:glucokinase n=1 Tax=Halorhodospira TaxID=85108 RepID=UPI00191131BE|nr:glucokinase [Halorhodospira halophila]MCG5538020.1 glucokinase [Halorhodospira sp. 9622]MCG5541256.1 glucokinase [Halorhodospira sp. M39old]MCG5542636.1 glucokinase [Halorhodospira sp. 9628]MCG5546358.1 glucokinase [Halorhodospira sp. M38]MCC3750199.1 glucokinase [Halorhodospira halophila]